MSTSPRMTSDHLKALRWLRQRRVWGNMIAGPAPSHLKDKTCYQDLHEWGFMTQEVQITEAGLGVLSETEH